MVHTGLSHGFVRPPSVVMAHPMIQQSRALSVTFAETTAGHVALGLPYKGDVLYTSLSMSLISYPRNGGGAIFELVNRDAALGPGHRDAEFAVRVGRAVMLYPISSATHGSRPGDATGPSRPAELKRSMVMQRILFFRRPGARS